MVLSLSNMIGYNEEKVFVTQHVLLSIKKFQYNGGWSYDGMPEDLKGKVMVLETEYFEPELKRDLVKKVNKFLQKDILYYFERDGVITMSVDFIKIFDTTPTGWEHPTEFWNNERNTHNLLELHPQRADNFKPLISE